MGCNHPDGTNHFFEAEEAFATAFLPALQGLALGANKQATAVEACGKFATFLTGAANAMNTRSSRSSDYPKATKSTTKSSSSLASRAETSAGDENPAYLLRQVAERLGISLVEALRPFDQTPSVYRVLIALTRRNPARMRELIDLTLIETSVLSRTVAKMKTQGLVKVTADGHDARAIVIAITATGRKLLGSMIPAVSAQYEWAVHDAPPEDLEVMRRTLARMLKNLTISPIK
jgi:Transcriptional regulators